MADMTDDRAWPHISKLSDAEVALELARRVKARTGYESKHFSWTEDVQAYCSCGDPIPHQTVAVERSALELFLDKRCAAQLSFDEKGKLISCVEITF